MGAGIPQTTVSSCTPTATGRSIANSRMWHHRVPQGAFERLELLEGKLSRAVLRGLSGSNPARLPGGEETYLCLLIWQRALPLPTKAGWYAVLADPQMPVTSTLLDQAHNAIERKLFAMKGVPSSRWQPTGVSHGAGPPV